MNVDICVDEHIQVYSYMYVSSFTYACNVIFTADHMMPGEAISFLCHMTAGWHKESLCAEVLG